MNRELGGVVAAGLGLLLLIGAVKGTWRKVFTDLFDAGSSKATGANGAAAVTPATPTGPAQVGNHTVSTIAPGFMGSGVTTEG